MFLVRMLDWLKRFFIDVFYFKAPVIKLLFSTDFVIEDRMFFMLSWEFAGRYKLTIPLLKKVYKARTGSVAVKIFSDVDFVHLKISTWWRTSHYTFYLNKLKLDSATARRLIQGLEPVKEMNIQIKTIQPIIYPETVLLPELYYKGYSPIVNLKIALQNNKLIYPDN